MREILRATIRGLLKGLREVFWLIAIFLLAIVACIPMVYFIYGIVVSTSGGGILHLVLSLLLFPLWIIGYRVACELSVVTDKMINGIIDRVAKTRFGGWVAEMFQRIWYA